MRPGSWLDIYDHLFPISDCNRNKMSFSSELQPSFLLIFGSKWLAHLYLYYENLYRHCLPVFLVSGLDSLSKQDIWFQVNCSDWRRIWLTAVRRSSSSLIMTKVTFCDQFLLLIKAMWRINNKKDGRKKLRSKMEEEILN